jgi:hypothetical protein
MLKLYFENKPQSIYQTLSGEINDYKFQKGFNWISSREIRRYSNENKSKKNR